MADLLNDVPAKALAVYAHPDDPDVACGGTLARWAARGCEVHVVICAMGEKGTVDPTVVPARLAEARAHETAQAGVALGVSTQHLLGHPDGELDEDELRAELVGMVREVKPDVVVCPDPEAVFFGQDYYNHRDHRIVGWATLDAVSPAAALPHYYPEAGPPHQVRTVYLSGTLAPDAWVDITANLDAKVSAVACHATQSHGEPTWVADVVRRRAADAGRRAGVRHAEGFRLLRLSGD